MIEAVNSHRANNMAELFRSAFPCMPDGAISLPAIRNPQWAALRAAMPEFLGGKLLKYGTDGMTVESI